MNWKKCWKLKPNKANSGKIINFVESPKSNWIVKRLWGENWSLILSFYCSQKHFIKSKWYAVICKSSLDYLKNKRAKNNFVCFVWLNICKIQNLHFENFPGEFILNKFECLNTWGIVVWTASYNELPPFASFNAVYIIFYHIQQVCSLYVFIRLCSCIHTVHVIQSHFNNSTNYKTYLLISHRFPTFQELQTMKQDSTWIWMGLFQHAVDQPLI